ncbi:MAG: hypothetical protein LBR07_01380 [Puniceicoccales bacterium]|nr:hypothetical protein [Puniceicoccales bacterium]
MNHWNANTVAGAASPAARLDTAAANVNRVFTPNVALCGCRSKTICGKFTDNAADALRAHAPCSPVTTQKYSPVASPSRFDNVNSADAAPLTAGPSAGFATSTNATAAPPATGDALNHANRNAPASGAPDAPTLNRSDDPAGANNTSAGCAVSTISGANTDSTAGADATDRP